MTFAVRYLREHLDVILMELLFVCVFAVVFYLYHLPLAAVMYPAFICFLAGCLFMVRSICVAYRKHKELTRLQSLPGNVMLGMVVGGIKTQERDYQQLICKMCQEMQLREDEITDAYREMTDYFTTWVHQIKTPIASMRLQLDAEDSNLSRRLRSELLRIEQYVEMVLTYFKMGADSSDYVFRTVSLDKVLRESIRKFRGDFIMKRLGLVYVPTDEMIVSDEKWLSFVVEQILSNALKYTNEGAVTISLEEPKVLCISDTGIGIAPEDIPRIFEKGYTGGNGHENKRASGLGLYLCRQICDRLGIAISIVSEVEKGTTVRLDLNQRQTSLKEVHFQTID
ncbi:MAG: sensor histidine kinase [Lachnospiraceae bacterium]|nr:sensor histidine kinase [Lachnospiraceae bacterium]